MLFGIVIVTIDVQFSKALLQICRTLFEILTFLSSEHPEKTLLFIFVILFGIVTLVSDLHSKKAESPIIFKLLKKEIFLSEEQHYLEFQYL